MMRRLITILIAVILLITIGVNKVNAQGSYKDNFNYAVKYTGNEVFKVDDIEENYLYTKLDDYGYVDIYLSQYLITDSTAVTYWEFIPQDKTKESFKIEEGSVISSTTDQDETIIDVVAILEKGKYTYGGVVTYKRFANGDVSVSLWNFKDGSVITYGNLSFVDQFYKEEVIKYKSERNISNTKLLGSN